MARSTELVADIYRNLDGPGWRVAVATRHPGRTSRLAHRDRLVSQVADFLGRRGCDDFGPSNAAEKYPDLDAAFRLWGDESAAERLMILAVADCCLSDMAEYLRVAEATVLLTESLFFDVRPCLHAQSWIAARVIEPHIAAGNVEFAAALKLAHYGGEIVAKSLLDAKSRLPLEEANRLFDREMLLHVKLIGVLHAPLGSPEAAADFLKLALEYETKKAKLQLERQKFEHRCAQDVRAHELEMLRLATVSGDDKPSSAPPVETAIEPSTDAVPGRPLDVHESAA